MNSIVAIVFLCPLGTLPGDCGLAKASQVHTVQIAAGACGQEVQAAIAGLWNLDGKEFIIKIVCEDAAQLGPKPY